MKSDEILRERGFEVRLRHRDVSPLHPCSDHPGGKLIRNTHSGTVVRRSLGFKCLQCRQGRSPLLIGYRPEAWWLASGLSDHGMNRPPRPQRSGTDSVALPLLYSPIKIAILPLSSTVYILTIFVNAIHIKCEY